MEHGSRRVVVLALLANLGIAAAKLVAALFTRSGALFAEAIHSFADSGNEALLLVGESRSSRPADERHPMGYGREAYFWALLVAVLLFTLGGLASVNEAWSKWQHAEALRHEAWALAVLLLSIALEAVSLRAAWREVAATRRGRGFFAWARSTGDVNVLVVAFEDLAALAGLLLALAALLLTWATGNPLFDALGSCAIGVLLLAVATFLASQVRRLITGHSVDPETRALLVEAWSERGFDVLKLSAVWAGPRRMTVAAKVRPRDLKLSAAALIEQINAAERVVRERLPEVIMQFSEPDFSD